MALPDGIKPRPNKRVNTKFRPGNAAYDKRQSRLADIVARMSAGKGFSDLQVG